MKGAVRRTRKVDPNGNIYYDRGVSDIIIDPERGTSVKQDIDELRNQMLTAMKFIAANPKGMDGKSAYEIAVEHGFVGTEEEWIASVTGVPGEDGLSAYEIACIHGGFTGTIEEWLQSLIGPQGERGKSAYEVAVDNGYEGTEEEWCNTMSYTVMTVSEVVDMYTRLTGENPGDFPTDNPGSEGGSESDGGNVPAEEERDIIDNIWSEV